MQVTKGHDLTLDGPFPFGTPFQIDTKLVLC